MGASRGRSLLIAGGMEFFLVVKVNRENKQCFTVFFFDV